MGHIFCPVPSHSIAVHAHPIPSHGIFPMGIPFPWKAWKLAKGKKQQQQQTAAAATGTRYTKPKAVYFLVKICLKLY